MFEEISSSLRILHYHNSAFARFSARVLLAKHADFHIIKIASSDITVSGWVVPNTPSGGREHEA